MAEDIRVRFAPSPTGHLHIGGARTALFNYLYARRQNGVFVLRIEDTDAERSTDESVRMILQDLKWLGLTWDEGPEVGGEYGPYFQTQRLDLYREKLEFLLERGHAYACFCSSETLEKKREQAMATGQQPKYDGTCRNLSRADAQARIKAGEAYVVRLKLPTEGTTIIDDRIRGKMVFENNVLDDFVLARTNGLPMYNFAAVVDDAAMKISHVIRGDDHISNTPRQILLYQALGEPLPAFAHVPMILGADKTRLSKRHGATSVGAYADEGYLPQALTNYLALLGWSFDDKTTLFTREQLIDKFSLKKVSKNPAVFDPAKLQWMNGIYIRQLPAEEYVARALPVLIAAGLLPEPLDEAARAWGGRVALLVKEHLKIFTELPAHVSYFFGETVELDETAKEKMLLAKERPDLFKSLHQKMSMLESFTHKGLEEMMKVLLAEAQVKFGDLVHPLRAAVTGRANSPGIFEVLELLGKERTVKRLAAGLASVGITTEN
ncbi:MAG: glutamate--tRNA ligase [Candidatus Firestonebacteria bacterium]|nr:glutamate--tRNA ligase [Candidatus Firestonebacteria bacterium]